MRWPNRIWRSLFPNALRLIGDPQTCWHTHDSDALVMAYTTISPRGSDFYPGGLTPTEHLSFLLDMRLDLPLPHEREFEVVIMIAVVTGEMVGSD